MVFLNNLKCNPSDEHCPYQVHFEPHPSLLGSTLSSSSGLVSSQPMLSKEAVNQNNNQQHDLSNSTFFNFLKNATLKIPNYTGIPPNITPIFPPHESFVPMKSSYSTPRYATLHDKISIIPPSQVHAAESQINPQHHLVTTANPQAYSEVPQHTEIVKQEKHTDYTPLLIYGGLILVVLLMMR